MCWRLVMSLIDKMSKNVAVKKVDPNKCEMWKYADRSAFESKETVTAIAESFKTTGQLQPAIAIQNQNKNSYDKNDTSPDFFIIAGQNRWRAAKEAGIELEIIVKNISDEEQLIKMMYDENEKRKEIHPISRGKLFSRMAEEKNMTLEEVGKFFNLSKQTVSEFIKIYKTFNEEHSFYSFSKSCLSAISVFISTNNLSGFSEIPNIKEIIKLNEEKKEKSSDHSGLTVTEVKQKLAVAKKLIDKQDARTTTKILYPIGSSSDKRDWKFEYNPKTNTIKFNRFKIKENTLEKILELVS